ncbi:enoyl-CoA hydratase/isomerase family protein [Rhizobium sp. SSA_523]|uniref:enoyl-CoA hydratase/isomerase family protein n=1 Tax=Rhizobium sp. SSA_523 TaxID=2952477 RepID=UPI0020919ACD|nr:enoyl-CoA hydratase/isomerase family protein [Rhizobium sp. SSA_523]MCO5732424.1 enoyl-CoA hydratase/isomerase family protein [Rhizobium sp. SSA_523]WKC22433.1 enoyl-CoA hydratase/isomerase family protein [Rhizobium sp. SSA_523]
MSQEDQTHQDISVRRQGRVGHITLTRAKVLNAVNRPVVDAMTAALTRWADDPDIALVMVDADSEKAFSAGGDLTSMYHYGKSGDFTSGNLFWRDEYRLNALIARFPKPYVAVMDGIVMGGGVGISAHGSHRVVTEHSVVAMPECAIGLIPDVGGSYLLRRAPGRLGEYFGLTGARMDGATAIHAGFADFYVRRESLPALKQSLLDSGDISQIESFASEPPESEVARLESNISRVFDAESVTGILDRLATEPGEWAQKALASMTAASPISLLATLSTIRRADDLNTALRNEYRFVSRVLEHGDFVEGIRAIIIDKDRSPRWRYPEIGAVPPALLAQMASEAEGGDPSFAVTSDPVRPSHGG